jgi:hypothetical protein
MEKAVGLMTALFSHTNKENANNSMDPTNSSLCCSQALNKTGELPNGDPATVGPSLFKEFRKVKVSQRLQERRQQKSRSFASPLPLSPGQTGYLKINPQLFSGRENSG